MTIGALIVRAMAIVVGCASFALAGCGEEGGVYPIPAAELRQKLMSTTPPPVIFGVQQLTSQSKRLGDGTVIWTMKKKGKPHFRYIATTEAVDNDNTRLQLTLVGPTDDANDPQTQYFENARGIQRLYLRGMEQAILAKMENRPIDLSSIQSEIALHAAADVNELFDEVDASLDSAVAKFDEGDRRRKASAQRASDAKWEQEIESAWQE